MSNLKNKRVLITSGPTVERIDPVRYISNFSSGKMGKALSDAFSRAGANVCVVTGPVSIKYDSAERVISIESAREMFEACKNEFDSTDIAICCAAVCDYRPKHQFDSKLKKEKDDTKLSCIELTKNPDILKTLSKLKNENQYVVGFCAETNSVIDNAKSKLKSKSCDMIVANDVSEGKVFGKDDTSATIVTDSSTTDFKSVTKAELANLLVELISKELNERTF